MKISAKLSGQQEGRYKKLWAQACQSPHLSVRLEEVKDSENNRKDKLFEYRKGAYSTKVRNILIKGCYTYRTSYLNIINLLRGMAVGNFYIITLTETLLYSLGK